MRTRYRLTSAIFFSAVVLGSLASTVGAEPQREDDRSDRAAGAVFVQSNDIGANQVLVYDRANNGALAQVASYGTGGQGGKLGGAAADPLASQSSLAFDASHHLLIGVNAGSDSIYSFNVEGDRLSERQVLSSGGEFPVSVATHGDLVYVLNARAHGSVHGYRIDDGHLESMEDSTRSLGLATNLSATEFLTSPGQVGFTPDGRHLVVTTKASGSHIDVFAVNEDGRLSQTPVANASATPVPFAFTFDSRQHLVVGEAGSSSVSTYVVHNGGTLTPIASVPDGQIALCWITSARGADFVSNAGNGTVSGYRIDARGRPTLVSTTSVGPGVIDSAAAAHGAYLYVQVGGNGTIAELKVNRNGTLTSIGSVLGHPGQEGIVAV